MIIKIKTGDIVIQMMISLVFLFKKRWKENIYLNKNMYI